MTSKPKSRKLPQAPQAPPAIDTHGDQPAPAEASAHTNDDVQTPDNNEDGNLTRKSARKRRGPPPGRRELGPLPLDERLKKLAKLPSLETPPADTESTRAMDWGAKLPGPSVPLPPEEPTASEKVDRG